MRILVVDDDRDFLLLAKKALEARTHEVETATGAFGLVNRVASSMPDVVVLDCEMPGLSGFSVVELLAKDRRTSHVPVLLVSAGDGQQHELARATNPRAGFYRKDGRMKAFVDEVEHHARLVEIETRQSVVTTKA